MLVQIQVFSSEDLGGGFPARRFLTGPLAVFVAPQGSVRKRLGPGSLALARSAPLEFHTN